MRYEVLERTPTLERILDRYTDLVEYVYTPDVDDYPNGGRYSRGFVTREAEARHPGAREAMLKRLRRRTPPLT